MQFYWIDRNGRSPLPESKIAWRPFFSSTTTSAYYLSPPLPLAATYRVVQKTYMPSKETWHNNVLHALSLISQGKLKKVVLARACILELQTAPDPFAVVAALKQKSQGAYVYCIASPTTAFLGASPERLFKKSSLHVETEALAGTRARGPNPQVDAQLAQELLTSDKDLREFFPVRQYLCDALSPLCAHPPLFSVPSVYQTANVQHLYSQGSALLTHPVSDEALIERLHPTPALCGLPKSQALSVIQELEPFDRGLYGGVIGCMSGAESEWIVAIRSCKIEGKWVTLYSGTGIVEGSDPTLEWEELNHKLALYDGIFTH